MTAIDVAKPGPLMAGKRGLIMGVANDRSIAWGIARVLAGQGAKLAFTYQGDAFGRRAMPLAKSVGAEIIAPCDVADLAIRRRRVRRDQEASGAASISSCMRWRSPTGASWPGRYADTTRENFTNTMVISCFSFTEIAKRAAELMPNGGSLLTLTYGGATRWVPSYNVMGVAKAALEASVRYLAADLGPSGIRVNALSAGPMRTLAGAGVVRCARDLQLPARPLAAAAHADARRGRRRRRSICCRDLGGRGDRRGALRRLRLQHRLDADPRRAEGAGGGCRRRRPARIAGCGVVLQQHDVAAPRLRLLHLESTRIGNARAEMRPIVTGKGDRPC